VPPHTSTLTPLLETSATMVDAHASSNGLSIVGFYQVRCLYELRKRVLKISSCSTFWWWSLVVVVVAVFPADDSVVM